MKFEELDKKMRDWLTSETVTGIIVELNDKFDTIGPEVKIIPQAIRALVTDSLKPEQFTEKLRADLFFLSAQDIAKIVITVKDRVLKPIAGPMKSILGIDINKIPNEVQRPAAPTAKVIKMEKIVQPPVNPSPVSQQKPPASDWQPTPKARVMEFSKVTDIKAPVGKKIPVRTEPAAPTPKPEVSAPPKPFGLSEDVPKAPSPFPKGSTPQAGGISNPPSPVATPPLRKEEALTEYHDDHPVAPPQNPLSQ